MHLPKNFCAALCLGAVLCLPLASQADSFTSSASSAGSASSGSVSDSLNGSSNSSSGDRKTADADYRITDVAQAPGRDGFVRVTLQTDQTDAAPHLVLDLPAAVFTPQRLARGDTIRAAQREWGMEFARADTREAFFLVLADNWYGELEPRRVDRAS